MMKTFSLLSLSILFTLASYASPLTVELKVYAVTTGEGGAEQFVEVEEAAPGQILEYRADFRNVSTANLRGVTPEVPVPEGMVVITDSVEPAAVAANLDGEGFVPYILPDESGETIEAERIRGVRWASSDLAPEGATTVSLRVRVVE